MQNIVDEEFNSILEEWGYEKPCAIGRGSFAKVFRIKSKRDSSFCACKISNRKEMLWTEAEVLQEVKHQLFPYYLDYKEKGECGFLFMEYIPGQNLGMLMKRRGKMSQRSVIGIGMALAEGLSYLHELPRPVWFRDLKPENIMLQEDGRVKLLDFGSAAYGKNNSCVVTGTVGYGAPEQWTDAGGVGSYSDVYALGKVLTFLLGGGKCYWGLKKILEDATRVKRSERIPEMRFFQRRLQPYASGIWHEIMRAELRALFLTKQEMYIYTHNIIKKNV